MPVFFWPEAELGQSALLPATSGASEQALGLALLGESLVKIEWLALSPFDFRNCGGSDSVRRAREALSFSAAQSSILNCRAAYKHDGRANRSAELLAVLKRSSDVVF